MLFYHTSQKRESARPYHFAVVGSDAPKVPTTNSICQHNAAVKYERGGTLKLGDKMRNPGNTGNRYKMSKLVALTPQENVVIVSLECGHTKTWYPFSGQTTTEFIEYLQQGYSHFEIGKTRVRCTERHDREVKA